MTEESLSTRLRTLALATPSLGYRALHAQLKQDPDFQHVSLKKVQTLLQEIRGERAQQLDIPGECNLALFQRLCGATWTFTAMAHLRSKHLRARVHSE